jgi:hypothetical protein
MKSGLRRMMSGAVGTMVVCLMAIASAHGQAAPAAEKPLMADDVFKNIQVLKGMPVKEFMETMGFFAASLGANCTTCHVAESGGNWARYADDDLPKKQTARKMVLMMTAINRTYFAGRRVVTCYSCHRFGDKPKVTPNLAEQYGTPPPEEPDTIDAQAAGQPAPEQILDKYLQAVGGVQRLTGITSFVAKGLYQGYDDTEMHPVEIYAKAPNQRAMFVHTRSGDSTTTYDGRIGWSAAPDTDTPVPVVALTGGDLEGAKVDALLSFPAMIKTNFTKWRTGFPATIEDKDIQVIQGTTPGGSVVKLYFDPATGLMVRSLRYNDVQVGLVPTQTDYSDYRDVNGVKMPFHITVTWTDGRAVMELSEIQANVAVDAAKFAKPAAPAPVPNTRASR